MSVALVHDDAAFTTDALEALESAGFHVVAFSDPMVALGQIEYDQSFDTLITRISFPDGKPNGVSLALVLHNKNPDLHVVFVGRGENEVHTSGVGVLIPHPVDVGKLVEAVRTRPDST